VISDITQRLNEIHVAICQGSPTASRDLFLTALSPLRGFLAPSFPGLSEDDLNDLATDAMMTYLESYEECDLNKGSLWGFLCTIARKDALDLVRKRGNRERIEENLENDVEFWSARANYVFDGDQAIDARKIMRKFGRRLVTDEQEARFLRLMLLDEKNTEAYAIVLGVEAGSEEAERAVKQVKDRMMIRMKRLRDELSG
jgi:DNA-directed RNA polymerase specialized sigma24 family protein